MSDNVRRDNRRALPKYLLTILLFGLLGGVLGFFTGVAGAAGVAETVRQALDRVLAVCAPWGIVGSAVVLLGAGWYLYAAAKRRFAAWDGEDEDAMDTFNLARMDADDDRHHNFAEDTEFQESGFDIEDAPEDAGADLDADFDDDDDFGDE